ncbi:hypothetical protein M422DRAFT_239201 [Sphaerobolus stellatus SS14]|nr:hypothetical protein M422DRAFT_239201 [Sphaerobolus stellatus SS14]
MSRLNIVPLPHPPPPPSNYLHTLALIHPEQRTIIQFFNSGDKSNLLQDVISQGIHASSPSTNFYHELTPHFFLEELGLSRFPRRGLWAGLRSYSGTMKFVPHSIPGEEVWEIEAAKLELILRIVLLSYLYFPPATEVVNSPASRD